ncbi:hypothetical protein BC833DRAFT_569653 [Globomyces pollinis-pini]|nr:hypothetical protein BC833DRAFT_569653 [Globomyces pollinis-pini]
MSDIIPEPVDYTYPVVISCLSTLVELIGVQGIIDVISSPVKSRMVYFFNLVVMVSTLIQGVCQHMTIANTLPSVYCNPINVFSNAFWHIQFTLAEARWLYQAYVFAISKKRFRSFRKYFFSFLIIGRAGVGFTKYMLLARNYVYRFSF